MPSQPLSDTRLRWIGQALVEKWKTWTTAAALHVFAAVVFVLFVSSPLNGQTVIDSFGAGSLPTDVAVDEGGRRLFVPNFDAQTVTVLNADTHAIVAVIPTGSWGYSRPVGAEYNHVTNRLYVAHQSTPGHLLVINGTDYTLIDAISTAGMMRDVDIDRSTNQIYVTANDTAAAGRVLQIDGLTHAVTSTAIPPNPSGLRVNTLTKRIFAVAGVYLSVLDAGTMAVIANVPVRASGSYHTESYPAVNERTDRVYITDDETNVLTMVDGSSLQVLKTVSGFPGGRGLTAVAVNSGTNRVFAATFFEPSGSVTILDGSSLERLSVVAMCCGNYRVIIDPTDDFAYVVNHTSSTITIIHDDGPPATDTTPPEILCGAADGAWHGGDVTIACTASDLDSGLANGEDASFTLTTNVPTGTETANAATNSRQVCDQAGNCATAGPLGGNKVDKKAPTVSCASADAAWHATDVALPCSATDAGSGLSPSDASFSLATSVPSETETASASTASRNVCDIAGNCSTAGPISGNKVDKKGPIITITSPATNATYQRNSLVAANYACTDGGSGAASCQGPVSNGSAIDTSSTGTKTFTVVASDVVGNTSSLMVSYSVASGGGGGSTSADLGIALLAPTKASSGFEMTYELNVSNGGPATATGVTVSDALPPGTLFTSASTTQGTISAPPFGSNGTVTVNVGSLANGGTASISIVVKVTAPSGELINTATVTASTQDLNNRNNSASRRTVVK